MSRTQRSTAERPPLPNGSDCAPGFRLLMAILGITLIYATISFGLLIIKPLADTWFPEPPRDRTTWPFNFVLWPLGVLLWLVFIIRRWWSDRGYGEPHLTIVTIACVLSGSIVFWMMMLMHLHLSITESSVRVPDPDVEGAWRLATVLPIIGASWALAIPVALTTTVLCARTRDREEADRRLRRGRVVVTVVLLLPLLWPLVTQVRYIEAVAVISCLPTTAFAVWIVYGLQRHRRIPFRFLAGAITWGCLIAAGYGMIFSYVAQACLLGLVRHLETVRFLTFAASPAVFEEVGKAGGVVLICLIGRRWIDTVSSGMIIGAAVGIGFNFAESVLYMSLGDAAFNHWLRQIVGALTSHATFAALTGAGVAIAVLSRSWRLRLIAAAAGLTAAIACHLANNYLQLRLEGLIAIIDHEWVSTLILHPATLWVVQAPITVGALLLLTVGLREQSAALASELAVEAETGSGVITWDEVEELTDPNRRYWLHLLALLSGGPRSYCRICRKHAAQLDLAMTRWHRTQGRPDVDDAAVESARLRVKLRKRMVGSHGQLVDVAL